MPATGRTRRAPADPLDDLGLDHLDDPGVPDDPGAPGVPDEAGAPGAPGGAIPARRPGAGSHSLLRQHRWIELARAGEYTRTGRLGPETEKRIRRAVLAFPVGAADGAAGSPSGGAAAIVPPDPPSALEARVRSCLPDDARVLYEAPVRDDVRGCARLMRGRERLLETVTAVSRLSRASLEVAARHTGSVMPGCPRRGDRPAQAMTFGFYLAALAEATAGAAESLQALFDAVNLCPLGAGVMTGLESPLDRHRLAVALGFDGPQPHALTSAVSGAWVLRSAAELSVLGTTLNRFLNDLIRWAGPDLGFVGPPDVPAGTHPSDPPGAPAGAHPSGPPVLERIRDLARRLTELSYEITAAQRDLGYADPDGIGPESGRAVEELFTTCGTMLALFERVVTDVRFHPESAGRAVRDEAGVRRRRTAGSTGPEQVLLLLDQVGDRLAAVDRGTAQRSGWLREAWEHTAGTKADRPS